MFYTSMIGSTINSPLNLYKDFSSGGILSAKNYLSYSYGQKPLYYNDTIRDEKRKSKNNKVTKIYAYIGTGIAVLATIGLILNNRYSNPKNTDIIKQTPKLIDKITNISGNFMNIKDDLWDKFANFTKDIKGLKWIKKSGDKITNLYKKAIKSSLRENYDKFYNKYIDNGGSPEKIPDFDTWFSNLDVSVNNLIHSGKRVSDGILSKDTIGKIHGSHIANEKIMPIYLKPTEFYSNTGDFKIDEPIRRLNKEQQRISKILIPKLRDVNCGSAPTDMLTIIASSIGLGGAILHSDNKQDRKSILVNLGIPIIGSLGLAIYGTLKCLSGATSMLLGLAAGNFISQSTRVIDNALAKKMRKKTPS